MNGRTGFPHCVVQDCVPFGAAAQKGKLSAKYLGFFFLGSEENQNVHACTDFRVGRGMHSNQKIVTSEGDILAGHNRESCNYD